MAKLILHIGGARTGSTSIQSALSSSRADLERQGVLYPQTGIHHGSHHLLVVAIQGCAEPGIEPCPAFQPTLEALGDEVRASGCETVVVSSDLFQKLGNVAGHPVVEANLKTFLGLFREVKVLCFLRHQVPYLESWYRFRVWWQQSSETADFSADVSRSLGDPYLDYRTIERFYGALRPDLAFEFLSFAAARKSGQLVRYFYERAGILRGYSGEVRTNESLSRAGTLALLARNRGVLPAGGPDFYAFMNWAQQAFPERSESLYDPALLRAVADRFVACNAELARFTGFDLNDELAEFEQKQALMGSVLSAEFQQMLIAHTQQSGEFTRLNAEFHQLKGEHYQLNTEFHQLNTELYQLKDEFYEVKHELDRMNRRSRWEQIKDFLGWDTAGPPGAR